MNPIQWLKAIYETFGTPYPRASLVAVTLLGAITFAAIWLFAAKQVQKGEAVGTPSQVTGPASTAGPESPAITGNGNTFKYDQSAPKEKKEEKQ
jgi:hypothetical protein